MNLREYQARQLEKIEELLNHRFHDKNQGHVSSKFYCYGWRYNGTFESEIEYTVSDESAHPELGRPFARMTIRIITSDTAETHISLHDHTDSVPVAFISYKKESSRNISKARALKRKFDEWCRKYIYSMKLDPLDPCTVTYSLAKYNELEKFRKYTFGIVREVRNYPRDVDNLVLRTRTFYLGGIKIGTSGKVSEFIRDPRHAKYLRHFTEENYPILYREFEKL